MRGVCRPKRGEASIVLAFQPFRGPPDNFGHATPIGGTSGSLPAVPAKAYRLRPLQPVGVALLHACPSLTLPPTITPHKKELLRVGEAVALARADVEDARGSLEPRAPG